MCIRDRLPVGFLLLFTYTPVVNMFWYSVTSWDGLSKEQEYIGLENYIRVFTRPEYFQVFYVILFYFVASFVQLGIALYFATILSFQTKFKNFFKGVLFFPYLINGVAIAFTFLYFFKPGGTPVSYTHLRAHETVLDLVCRLLLAKKK